MPPNDKKCDDCRYIQETIKGNSDSITGLNAWQEGYRIAQEKELNEIRVDVSSRVSFIVFRNILTITTSIYTALMILILTYMISIKDSSALLSSKIDTSVAVQEASMELMKEQISHIAQIQANVTGYIGEQRTIDRRLIEKLFDGKVDK